MHVVVHTGDGQSETIPVNSRALRRMGPKKRYGLRSSPHRRRVLDFFDASALCTVRRALHLLFYIEDAEHDEAKRTEDGTIAKVHCKEHNIADVTCGMEEFLTSLDTKENMLHFMKDSFIRTF